MIELTCFKVSVTYLLLRQRTFRPAIKLLCKQKKSNAVLSAYLTTYLKLHSKAILLHSPARYRKTVD